jgi:hypothetical protein
MAGLDDDLIELRFEDIPVDMDELISDIINEEFGEEEEEEGGNEDGVDEYGQTRTKTNKRKPAGMTVSTDKEGRPSILSMRTSLMSTGMADKFLEGLMNMDMPKHTPKRLSSGISSGLPKKPTNGVRRYSSTGTTGTTGTNTWLMRTSVIEDYDYDDITDEDIGSSSKSSMQRYSISSDPQQQQQHQQPDYNYNYNNAMNNNNGNNRRFSISANPDLFGGGGTPININDESCSSMRFSLQMQQDDPSLRSLMFGNGTNNPPPQTEQSMDSNDLAAEAAQHQLPPNTNTTTKSMRFSISRKALSMFDRPFDTDNLDDEEYDEGSFSSMNDSGQVKPVEVLSNELKKMYGKETENINAVQEEALANEMELLSFTHKSKINFDVHGIQMGCGSGMNNGNGNNDSGSGSGGINNDLDNVDEYLKQLDDELKNAVITMSISNNGNGNDNDSNQKVLGFVEAQKMNPNYVNSKEFRLMFLRMYLETDHNTNIITYDVDKAANKLLLHFQTKKIIFGNGDVLGRDVRLSDLDINDRIAMDSGALQIMPDRDTAGRAILLYAPGQRIFEKVENWMKAMWYLMFLVAKDIENQMTGICIVIYFRGFTDKHDTYEQAQKIASLREGMPCKLVALHYCYQDESLKALITAQKVHFLTRNLRSRLRDHYSTDHNEICFQLETYGIPIDKEILLPNGHLGMKWYNEWIVIRQSQEAELITSGTNNGCIGVTITPRKFDVLFGRGRTTREHVGNLRCAHLVEMHQLEYEQCSKTEKTELAKRIVTMVKECNGRFLKKDRKVRSFILVFVYYSASSRCTFF